MQNRPTHHQAGVAQTRDGVGADALTARATLTKLEHLEVYCGSIDSRDKTYGTPPLCGSFVVPLVVKAL
jgi:hypothetical protein